MVTIHMLKGDASKRAFYVLPGSGTEPPSFELSKENEKRFADFCTTDEQNSTSKRRLYFYLNGDNLEEELYKLGRMKSCT